MPKQIHLTETENILSSDSNDTYQAGTSFQLFPGGGVKLSQNMVTFSSLSSVFMIFILANLYVNANRP